MTAAPAPEVTASAPPEASVQRGAESKPSLAPGATIRVEYIVRVDQYAEFVYGRAGNGSPAADGTWSRGEEVSSAESWKKDVTLVVPEITGGTYPRVYLDTYTKGATCEIRINGIQYVKKEAPSSLGAKCQVFVPTKDFHTGG